MDKISMSPELVDILLLEDNHEDAELTIRALKKNNLTNHLLHLSDGEEGLRFLFSTPAASAPKLILLDLKMPKVDGIEVLRKLKNDAEKKTIPVVVLTSSKEHRDIQETYQLGVNAYIVKPVDFEQCVKTVAEIGIFWLLLNQQPR